MSEIEILEEDPEPDQSHDYYVNRISLEELRRYVCIDMARMCGCLPDKTVDLAKKMENFLLGKGLRAVDDK